MIKIKNITQKYNYSCKIYTVITMIFLVYYLIALQWFIPNMGGSGFRLPQNMLGMIAIAAVIFCITVLKSGNSDSLYFNNSMSYVLCGGILLTLPLLWSDAPQWLVLPNLLGLWSGIALLFMLLQIRLTGKQKRLWLALILAGCIGQAGLAFVQLLDIRIDGWIEMAANYDRIYGIFQQPNVLASFCATGFAIALHLFFTSRRWQTRLLYTISLLLFTFIIPMTQSRIGWLSLVITAVLLFWHYRYKSTIFFPALLSVVGITLAVATFPLFLKLTVDAAPSAMPEAMQALVHSGSNSERLLILKTTLKMIAIKPWFGWGLGGFENSLAKVAIASNGTSPFRGSINHPHNEVLYRWAEGGIAALLGCIALGLAFISPLFSRKNPNSSRSFPLLVCALPIVLHSQVEYPLHHSAAHGMTLIILLRLAFSKSDLHIINLARWVSSSARSGMALLSAALLLYMTTGLETNRFLTQIERQGLDGINQSVTLVNPYIQWERLQYDKNIRLLQSFNATRDMAKLGEFREWGRNYVKWHSDENIYFILMSIAKYQGNTEEWMSIRKEAALIFPFNSRFSQ